jgi:hypothetical protein
MAPEEPWCRRLYTELELDKDGAVIPAKECENGI